MMTRLTLIQHGQMIHGKRFQDLRKVDHSKFLISLTKVNATMLLQLAASMTQIANKKKATANNQTGDVKKQFFCRLCKSPSFASMLHVYAHLRLQHNSIWLTCVSCPVCKRCMESKFALRNHIRMEHVETRLPDPVDNNAEFGQVGEVIQCECCPERVPGGHQGLLQHYCKCHMVDMRTYVEVLDANSTENKGSSKAVITRGVGGSSVLQRGTGNGLLIQKRDAVTSGLHQGLQQHNKGLQQHNQGLQKHQQLLQQQQSEVLGGSHQVMMMLTEFNRLCIYLFP